MNELQQDKLREVIAAAESWGNYLEEHDRTDELDALDDALGVVRTMLTGASS